MFFERKYTTCLTDMPRQRIPQTHKAIKIGNLEGSLEERAARGLTRDYALVLV